MANEGIIGALQLFDRYVDMPAAEQFRALKELEANQPDLHAALAALLAADRKAHALDAPLPDLLSKHAGAASGQDRAAADARVGTLLGPWLIEETLASGGMGTVYRARRADGQYRQRAALKCIRTELSSPALVSAFLNERNNLAHLDHPHIAMLLDGGVENNGQPWFAMRCVEGEPIDRWCDQRHAGVRKRVELLVQLCDAMGYAHRKGVLHQDIKPSNLLITQDGQLQVVDFGLSSMRAESAYERRIAISYGYAAPEAHSGGNPSAAMDIYSIGMVMYQLLCDAWPRPAGSPHALAAPAPPIPLEQLAARSPQSIVLARGQKSAPALARELRGDLSAIAMKCVAADPTQRYASADELGEELRRYLTHRPLAIRREERGYDLRKFVRRNRVPVMLATLAAAMLVSGVLAFAWQTHRAKQEVAATEAVSHLFESTLGTATLSGLGETGFSSVDLIARTESDLRRLELAPQPRVLARALSVLAKNYAVVGEYDHARRLAEEVSALSKGTDEQQQAENGATLASLLNVQAKHERARAVAAEGLKTLGDAKSGQEESLRLRLLNEMALAQWGLADRDAALTTVDTAVALARKKEDADATATLLAMRGYWQSRMYRLDQAEKDLSEATALSGNPDSAIGNEARIALARTLIAMDRTGEAAAVAKALLQSRLRVLGETHPETGRAWIVLASSQFSAGQNQESGDSLDRGKKIIAASFGTEHPEYADILRLESNIDYARNHRESGLAKAREALRITEKALGDSHDMTMRAKLNLAHKLAAAQMLAKDYRASIDEAISIYDNLVRVGRIERLPQPSAKLHLARRLLERNGHGDTERAAKLLDECALEGRLYFGPHASYISIAQHAKAILLYRAKKYAEADRLFSEIIGRAKDVPQTAVANALVHESLVYLAFSSTLSGRKSQAKAYLQQDVAGSTKAFGADHLATREAKRYLEELERTGTIREAEEN